MHILILPSELYCPPKMPLMGIFQRHQAELLAGGGNQVGVVSFGYIPWRFLLHGFPYPAKEESPGLNVIRQFAWPLLPARFAHSIFRRQFLRRAQALVRSYINIHGRPDVIHAHNSLYAGLVAARFGRESGIPVVLTEHSSAFYSQSFSHQDLDDIKEAIGASAIVSAVGTNLANRLSSIVSSGNKDCVVLGNLLDPFVEARAHADAEPLGGQGPGAGFTALAVGALSPVKNHQLLLKSFARAFKGDPSACLRLGGGGSLGPMLHSLADSLGIRSQVEFLGPLSREQVVLEMSQCDVFVSSSTVETFGVVLIEAMAFGKPVLATRSGGPQDIIQEGQGLLVDVDEEDLARGLVRIRQIPFDSMAIHRHCIDSYGSAAFFTKLMTLYHSACGQTLQVVCKNVQ
jgi:glycosyltransferase involved in cell wall biosynthesis